MDTETLTNAVQATAPDSEPLPGIVIAYGADRPQCVPLRIESGALELGRDELAAAVLPDGRASRRHVRVEHEPGRWTVRDLGSRNGTFVNAVRVEAASTYAEPPVIRIGRTVLLAVEDVRPFESPGLTVEDGVVLGPRVRALHERVALIARSGANLLLTGPSGAGKELAARAFHRAGEGGAERPFVALNCATIARDMAERVLFGARRGAYTGAVADATGLLVAADGGTLFLDEIAELDLVVQAKLLRVLETREVLPLGALRPVPSRFQLCAATLREPRAEVLAGRFREDLYFRVGRPEIGLPPLRERREEVAYLIEGALRSMPEGTSHASSPELVEACLLRPWPGNVRELLAEVKAAALTASAAGRSTIAATDLDPRAGCALTAPAQAEAAPIEEGAEAPQPAAPRANVPSPPREVIAAALAEAGGNVLQTATRLGLSRARLRRLLERHAIDPRAVRDRKHGA